MAEKTLLIMNCRIEIFSEASDPRRTNTAEKPRLCSVSSLCFCGGDGKESVDRKEHGS